jgi:hypothetical protein
VVSRRNTSGVCLKLVACLWTLNTEISCSEQHNHVHR